MTKQKRPYPSLRAWRRAHALRQCEAAAQLEVSQGYYSRLEHGQRTPHAQLAHRISLQTSVPLEILLGLA